MVSHWYLRKAVLSELDCYGLEVVLIGILEALALVWIENTIGPDLDYGNAYLNN
ncbi:MAG: hypothetical protein LH631_08715 [Alkalinema sp. CAN_BIN05]|nr:hypothetical protein [Alkalinema sp. CAN_BIN05]